jgi:hypothetical protein
MGLNRGCEDASNTIKDRPMCCGQRRIRYILRLGGDNEFSDVLLNPTHFSSSSSTILTHVAASA